ncbi:MAG: hypothetical protein PVS2B2_27030 [Candidatus Acidiferrum sp.]
MAHIYMQFDFGADEEKAQQARHKLDIWKQAFRLDKKLVFKFEREEAEAPPKGESAEKPKSKAHTKTGKGAAAADANVKLLLRLGFSGHEKITEHRWAERIPSEEPFRSSSPQVIKQGQAEFEAIAERFENLDRTRGAAGGGRELPG